MTIYTVEVNEILAENWLINKGRKDSFIAPMNYTENIESVEDAILKEKYLLLDEWFRGNTPKSYTETLEEKRARLNIELLNIHSIKVQEIQKFITNKTFTRELENEYSIKAVEAVKALEGNDFSFFELSAQLKGVTSKQYAELVVSKSQQMHDVEKQALRKIGDIRSFVSDLIDSEKFFQAQKMLDYIEEVMPEIIIGVSNEQLVELIQTYSN